MRIISKNRSYRKIHVDRRWVIGLVALMTAKINGATPYWKIDVWYVKSGAILQLLKNDWNNEFGHIVPINSPKCHPKAKQKKTGTAGLQCFMERSKFRKYAGQFMAKADIFTHM